MTDPTAFDSQSSNDATPPVNVKILAAGFGLGILAGAVLLVSRIGSDEQSPAVEDQQAERQALQEQRMRLKAELETLKLQQEVAALQHEVDELRTTPVSAPATSRHGNNQSTEGHGTSAIPTTGGTTLAYWNRMNDIIEQEAVMRVAPLGGITAANAGGFLEARIRAAEFAVDGLRTLDPSGVDQRAVAVAESVAAWYEAGRQVAEVGRGLLTQGSTQQRRGAAGQQYQAQEQEHAKAVDTVNAEGERVRRKLSDEYAIPFPPLK